MNDQTEHRAKSCWRRRVKLWIHSLAVIVLFYILSTGPLVMMEDRKIIRDGSALDQVLEIVYWPVEWACDNTPLEKPLGLYWHLWAPRLYDSSGRLIPVQSATERAALSAISKRHLSYQCEEPL